VVLDFVVLDFVVLDFAVLDFAVLDFAVLDFERQSVQFVSLAGEPPDDQTPLAGNYRDD
jgi:hypothetical protein